MVQKQLQDFTGNLSIVNVFIMLVLLDIIRGAISVGILFMRRITTCQPSLNHIHFLCPS